MMLTIIVIIYALLASVGLTLLKLSGGLKLALTSKIFNLEFSWLWFGGIMCYVFSFLMWISIINKYEKLSYIYTFGTSLVYISVLLMSVIILKEKLSTFSIIGSALILLGVILIQFK